MSCVCKLCTACICIDGTCKPIHSKDAIDASWSWRRHESSGARLASTWDRARRPDRTDTKARPAHQTRATADHRYRYINGGRQTSAQMDNHDWSKDDVSSRLNVSTSSQVYICRVFTYSLQMTSDGRQDSW